ncbi:MAG: MFS transporter [Hamadaea sp.]|uniref:MFS transporter n=1 Tax=Hamadaea sp. NPDC050747 TaxID=3155789 RepID=UPI001855BCD0|nr:MFS transporter [Hamadaea sp.]NUR47600.1 MFS transporter [Hamadaea sp.]NUT01964.1 MFS transporter [Hamadaea sp.]
MSETTGVKPPSLWRNKAFTLLWSSQALSDLGSSMSQLAMPLLTLAITGSPIQAGIVGTASAAVRLLCQLPAGVVTDRFDRKRLMLVSDAVRLCAYTLLAVLVLLDRVSLAWIMAVTMIATVFHVAHENAQFGAVRNVVPLDRVTEATARNEARGAAVSLVGPPIGGALFGFARALPFFADAVSYLLSFIGVALIRQPMQQERSEPREHPVKELAEGVKFTLSEPFLRAVLLIAPPINLAFNGMIFAMVVILQQQGTQPALIGFVETFIGVGLLVGALIAPRLSQRVPMRRLITGITWLGAALMASAALLTGSILVGIPVALAIMLGPACNAALFGYQAAVTPDRLQGRVMSVIFLLATSLASVSALLGGSLVHWVGGPATVLVFAGIMVIAAVAATFSQGVRGMKPLSELQPAT